MSAYDVMAPWGKAGPPPADRWRTDLLGPAFQSRTIDLLPDDEGEAVATLVAYRPHKDPGALPGATAFPRFSILFLHGRNDYFFHVEAARRLAAAGGAFYALDLRKYGRSLRPWQSIGYVDDLTVYDEEIGEALSLIRAEQGRLPLVLVGHSTGGLIATLWAHRHPGATAGLVLNSAWLEMQTMASLREAVQPVLGRIAARRPMLEVVGAGGPSFYGRSMVDGWAGSGLPLPERLVGHEDDPAVRGWEFIHAWKRPESYPAPAAWLDAVMDGHRAVERDVHLDCPVLSMMSTATYFGEEWDERVFSSDTVLDVRVNAERSANLGDDVTIARFPGKHDLFLSDPDVRERVYDLMDRWLSAQV
ncbi:alpha/beta hydrolase [Actinomyces sp. B33]|uniref:alpha/beta fold hydrolase n=1 Tax=Actinomyces sp. B33 TaxID=2942131 RepID=UPI002341BB6B|nr:alpha/beta hydrolase [Actinomyces sp. B33]MDC4233506.1 alpha/beta hydrolase [Actinomyces sp. B33]